MTAAKIDEARESYRPVASRASLLYFILNDLNKINMLYQFSLKAFNTVFQNAIKFAEPVDALSKRVANLIDSVTYLVFTYTSRGLFENDKLIFLCQLTLQVLNHLINYVNRHGIIEKKNRLFLLQKCTRWILRNLSHFSHFLHDILYFIITFSK